MANEFKHGTVGTQLTQAEWEAVGAHVFDSQARGDLAYASSTSQLSRLAVGGAGAVLTSDGTDPVWDTTWSPTGHLIPASDDSYDLGSSSAAWQDLFLEGDITFTDAGTINMTGDLTMDISGDIILDADGGDIFFKDAGTTFGSATNTSGNLIIKSGTTTAATFSGANVTLSGTVTTGSDGSGTDVIFYSGTAGDNLTWDASEEVLQITGTNGQTALDVLDGDVRIVDTLYFYDRGGEYMTSNGSTLSITGNVTFADGSTDVDIASHDSTNGLKLGGTLVASTAAELNIMDGGTSASTVTLVDADRVVVNDGGTMKQVAMTTMNTYFESEIDALSNLATVGTITSGTWQGTALATAYIADNAVTLAKMAGLARGKIIYGDSSGDPAALAVGSANYVLKSNGTDAAWGDIVNANVNSSAGIVDTKLATISTANKVALTALNIDGGTDIGGALATGDLIVVDDGAGGTNKFAALSRVVTLMEAQIDSLSSLATVGTVGTGAWEATDVGLAHGGTGASLSDPGADKILFWDDSASAMKFLTVGSNLSISATTITATNTTYTAGTNISLSGTTFNVDDSFLVNDGNDTTAGVITSAGYKLTKADAGGDVTVEFQQGGTTTFAMGIDDGSTGNPFKIHSGTALADTSDLTLDTSGNLTIGNGSLQAATIDYTDGDNAITIADGGGITVPQAAIFSTSIDITGSAGIILSNDETITNGTNGLISFSGNINVPDGGTIGSASDTDVMTIASTGVTTFSKAAVGATNTDTSNTGSITLDFDTYQNFVLTFTGNVTLANPTTEKVGQSGVIVIIQDGTGSRTLAVGDQYFGTGGDVPTISTAANSIDVVPYFVVAAGKVALGDAQLAFAEAS